MTQYVFRPDNKRGRRAVKYLDARAKIVERLKGCTWNSLNALRGLFLDRGFYPARQSVSDSTIRRVLADLEREGKITSKWKCVYPRFFLAYYWDGE